MKTEQKRQIALLHSKTNKYKKKLERAKEIVKDALSMNLDFYVAFSGGKDSTVILQLVKEQREEVIAIWNDEEWWLPETEEYNNLVAETCNFWRTTENDTHAPFFILEGYEINRHMDYNRHFNTNFRMMFLGLRKEESNTRRIHLCKMGTKFDCKYDKLWHINPIADFTIWDVWAYIFSNNLSYSKSYDRLDELGIDIKYQRTGPLAVDAVLGFGQLAILKNGWPDLYNKFCEKYPEARCY